MTEIPKLTADESGPSHGACLDCGRRYGDEFGFPDLIVSDDVWAMLVPEARGNGSGLLCPSCMCRRAYKAGIVCKRAEFQSGPFAKEAR